LRAIYFFIVYITVTLIRFINNHIISGKYNFMLSALIINLLVIAVFWTYGCLIKYFVNFAAQQMSS